jgi:signal transduction histidine kinase
VVRSAGAARLAVAIAAAGSAATGVALGVGTAALGWLVATAVLAVAWAVAGVVVGRAEGASGPGGRLLAVAGALGAIGLLSGLLAGGPDVDPAGPVGWARGALVAVLPALAVLVAAALPRPGDRRSGLLAIAAGACVPALVAGVLAAPGLPARWLFLAGVVAAALAGTAFSATCRRADAADRARLQWDGVGVLVTLAAAGVVVALSVLTGWPADPGPAVAAAAAAVPVGMVVSAWPAARRHAPAALVRAIVGTGVVVVVGTVLVAVVAGVGGTPDDATRGTVALTLAGVALAGAVAGAATLRLRRLATERAYGDRGSPELTLRTFATRMSRSIPMDELLLQLAESLRSTMELTAAEVWTGVDGAFERHVAVPHRDRALLALGAGEAEVASRTRVVGNAWLAVWAPALLDGRDDRRVRVAPIAHLGELLGFVVVERHAGGPPFDEDEDRVLWELSRQVGLALHNVRLDSALQASLDELRASNDELRASRARIVAASDESRRRIERDLHDGAQQHLVAMAVKVGLARSLLAKDPTAVEPLLEELRDDVQAAVGELRELAHGIFPPLLRDRGVAEALRAAAGRSPLPADVDAGDVGRFDAEAEAVVYFCCVEALQNAAKHAGAGAEVVVRVAREGDSVRFSVTDDGAGFDPAAATDGHGFVNMRDRLGAVGGRLDVDAGPGRGTTVAGSVPATPER